jgi:Tol biopolymer transport system component
MVRGTPRYLSPEQALAEPLDPRSDLFAVGLLLYELALGEPFFDQTTVTTVVASLLDIEERITVPSRLDTLEECIPGLPAVVRRCLRRDPDERYADARELRHALETLQLDLGPSRHSLREYLAPRAEQIWMSAHPSGPTPTLASPEERIPSSSPRNLGIALAALVLVIAVVVAGGLWWRSSGGVGVRSEPASEGARPAEPPPQVRTRVLVRGEADVREPSLSPDGSQVVFVRRIEGGLELVLREVDGSGERVLSEEPGIQHAQPAFSPDGTRVAFARSRGLYVMALDGGEAHRVTDSGVHPDWSPDGTRLAFTTEVIHGPEYKTTRSGLWVVDVESRRTHKVLDGDANMADWAPGGDRIAFWRAEEDGLRNVYTVAAEGGEPVAVTTGEATDWNPRWSPDGRHLYFFSDRAGTSALWRVAIEEESGRTLDTPDPVTTGGTASPGFLSTDRSGRRWVYHTWDSEQNLYIVPLVPLDGGAPGDPVEVTRGVRQLYTAALSPDGTQFAFGEFAEHEDVYVMNVDGTGQRRLTNDPHLDREVVWSPDGSRIAFHSNRDGEFRVWTIRPDGSDLRRVTSGEAALYPIWAPDGQRLAVSDTFGGAASIVNLDAEGVQTRREQLLLPHLETGVYSPTSWSPDGRRIALTWHGDEEHSVLVYDIETGEHAPVEVPACTSAVWLDNNTLLVRQRVPNGFVQIDWPGGAPVTRYEMPPDRELWWWVASPDGQSLIFILNTDRTALWVLDIE